MNKVDYLKLAGASLMFSGSVTAMAPAVMASERAQPSKDAKAAAAHARNAGKALAKKRFDKAIAFAEAAVAGVPGSADYRALLGQSYLSAGRFQSAESALIDALALDPGNARVAVNLALSQIAIAKNDKAIATLTAAKAFIPSADYGLALALAGDAEGAVLILEAAARGLQADAKTRQNLGLAYALANRWAQARAMAAQDLAAPLLDQRITEWALFTHQQASWDQVSSLLGVKPAYDAGMPTQLALNREPAPTTTVAIAMTAPEPAPQPIADSAPAPIAEVTTAPEPAFELPSAAAKPAFATPAILDAMTVSDEPVLIKADPEPVKQAFVPAFKPNPVRAVRVANHTQAVEAGRFVVQLGAFSTEARANIAWKQAYGRTRELGDHTVGTPKVQVRGASLYRLSVSGFTTQASAHQVCTRVKAAGGQCFVRSVANGGSLQWAKRGGTRLASRR